MKGKYRLGDTVFFAYTNAAHEEKQSFGIIKEIVITILDSGTTVIYHTDGMQFPESSILGRAVIQVPRVRKARPRRASAPVTPITDAVPASDTHPLVQAASG